MNKTISQKINALINKCETYLIETSYSEVEGGFKNKDEFNGYLLGLDEMTKELKEITSGITFICNRCGSTNVYVNSSDDGYYDYEEEWISFGSTLEIYCNDCGNGEYDG